MVVWLCVFCRGWESTFSVATLGHRDSVAHFHLSLSLASRHLTQYFRNSSLSEVTLLPHPPGDAKMAVSECFGLQY